MLSGRGKKEYAKEAQTVATSGPNGLPMEGTPSTITSDALAEALTPDEALVAL